MSWVTVNIILGVQLALIFFLLLNVNNTLQVVHRLRQWTLLLPPELNDRRITLEGMLKDFQPHLLKMIAHTKFIVVCATLVVAANIGHHAIVYLPLWAGIGYTMGTVLHLYQIHYMGNIINQETLTAENEWVDMLMQKTPLTEHDLFNLGKSQDQIT